MVAVLLRKLKRIVLFPSPFPICSCLFRCIIWFRCGAFVQALGWFSLQWPDSWHGAGISAMELVPVVLAAALWGKLWSGCHVCFYSDNTGVVGILSSCIARTPTQMHLLRCFSFFAAFFKFNYSVQHVSGVLNTAADALSRNNTSLFLSLIPQTPQWVLPCPLLELIVQSRPDWGSPTWTRLFVRSLAAVLPSPPLPPTNQGSGGT